MVRAVSACGVRDHGIALVICRNNHSNPLGAPAFPSRAYVPCETVCDDRAFVVIARWQIDVSTRTLSPPYVAEKRRKGATGLGGPACVGPWVVTIACGGVGDLRGHNGSARSLAGPNPGLPRGAAPWLAKAASEPFPPR